MCVGEGEGADLRSCVKHVGDGALTCVRGILRVYLSVFHMLYGIYLLYLCASLCVCLYVCVCLCMCV